MDLHLRLKNLCKSRGTSIAAIEARLGLGNGTAGKWWKNGRVPNFANLSAVAAELDTTVAYLTGETDDPSAGIKKDPIREDGAVSPAAQEILDFLDSASGEELADVIKYIRYLKSQRG
mgnify:FL=1